MLSPFLVSYFINAGDRHVKIDAIRWDQFVAFAREWNRAAAERWKKKGGEAKAGRKK